MEEKNNSATRADLSTSDLTGGPGHCVPATGRKTEERMEQDISQPADPETQGNK